MSLKSRIRKARRHLLSRIDHLRLKRAEAQAISDGGGSVMILPNADGLSRYLTLPADARDAAGRTVSCLMVTRGRLSTLEGALVGYENQDHPDRELVIVTNRDRADDVRRYVNGRGPRIRVAAADDGLTLGDLRNLSLSLAEGEMVCQWDDDDLYRPDRIRRTAAALVRSGSAAVMLRRLTVWWPERRIVATSPVRNWEGSMVAWRSAVPAYPSLARGEDTVVMRGLETAGGICQLDAPSLYVYRITGQNTWDIGHFDKILRRATDVRTGSAYAAATDDLLRRHPGAQALAVPA